MAFQLSMPYIAQGQRLITGVARLSIRAADDLTFGAAAATRACHSSSKSQKSPSYLVNQEQTKKMQFSPMRSRDNSGAQMSAKLDKGGKVLGGGRSSSSKSMPKDSHVSAYDKSNSCSMSSVMQTNVPQPFKVQGTTERSGHLAMPGGQWLQNDKYLSADQHDHHYRKGTSKSKKSVDATSDNAAAHTNTPKTSLGGHGMDHPMFVGAALDYRVTSLRRPAQFVTNSVTCSVNQSILDTGDESRFESCSNGRHQSDLLHTRIPNFNNFTNINKNCIAHHVSVINSASACGLSPRNIFTRPQLGVMSYTTHRMFHLSHSYCHSCLFWRSVAPIAPLSVPPLVTVTVARHDHTQRWRMQGFSSSASLSKADNSSTPRQKLQRAVKEYGITVVVFHVTISLASLGVCYLLVSSGIDMSSVIQSLGIDLTDSAAVANTTATAGSTAIDAAAATVSINNTTAASSDTTIATACDITLVPLDAAAATASSTTIAPTHPTLSTTGTVAAGVSTFVVAYAIHKVFAPVRIATTLSVTPFIVRALRAKGYLRPPRVA